MDHWERSRNSRDGQLYERAKPSKSKVGFLPFHDRILVAQQIFFSIIFCAYNPLLNI